MGQESDSEMIGKYKQQFDNIIEHVPDYLFTWIIQYLEANEDPWKDSKVMDDLIDRLTEYGIYRFSDTSDKK